MKIGLILAKPPSYSETFFNSKIKGLMENGHSVELFVREDDIKFDLCKVHKAPKLYRNPILRLMSSALITLSLVFYPKRFFSFLNLEKAADRSLVVAVKNTIKNAHLLKAKVDWLHFGFTTLAIDSEHVAKSIGAKMAVSCRGYDMDVFPLKHKNPFQHIWKNTDKVHAISEYMLIKAYENGLNTLTPNSIIYPAVNSSKFNDFDGADLKFSEPIKITTIARLHWIKGLDYTLEALSILKEKGVKFKYDIIGEGSEYESLRYAVHELKLENEVSFLGKLSHSDTLEQLKTTEIYLQYSHSEGFCNAVLEAQATGCLCIVSDGGGLPENVIDNKTGFVVKNRDSKALAETISRVLDMDELDLTTIKSTARTRVLKEFNIEKQVHAFLDFYE